MKGRKVTCLLTASDLKGRESVQNLKLKRKDEEK
jgi:hypothetical protein